MKRSSLVLTVLPYALIVALAIYLLFVARGFSASQSAGRLGPEVWPTMMLGLLIVSAVIGAIHAALQARRRAAGLTVVTSLVPSAAAPAADPDSPPNNVSNFQLFGGIAAMVGYVLVIELLGFTLSTMVLLFVLIFIAGYRRPIPAALCAVIGAGAFFFVFQKVVYVSLPLGVGIFAEFSSAILALFGVR